MSIPLQDTAYSPWHAGELALQHSVGAVERMDRVGRHVVRDYLLDQHRAFFPLLPSVVIGAVDPEGQVWATMKAGRPGFVHSPDAFTLAVDAPRDPADPAEAGLEDGDAIGLVGLDPMTRRRNRLNGTVVRSGGDGFAIEVGQSFGNCPRYIQNRAFALVRDPAQPSPWPALELDALDDRARHMIRTADTLYVASFVEREDGTRQVDASHRGGKPGFVRIGEDGVLTIPDFAGNLFFMTLGNLVQNPKAGLLFIDDATGSLLQMSGDAEVVLDSPEIAAFEGAERLLRFRPRRIVYRPEALPLRWAIPADGQSPHLQATGDWDEVGARMRA